MKVSTHFDSSEFQCKCHYPDCSKERAVDIIQVHRLEMLRSILNLEYRPKEGEWSIIIVSGWRCKRHNADVGGVAKSKHLLGIADDIKVKNSVTKKELDPVVVAKILNEMLPNEAGIGVYESFVHLDRRKKKARWHG